MTIDQQLNDRLDLVLNLTNNPFTFEMAELKPQEGDTNLIKALKERAKKMRQTDQSTQTELTMAQLDEMEKKVKKLSDKLIDGNLIDKNEGWGKQVIFRLGVIERGFDNMEDDLRHKETQGRQLKEKFEALEKQLEQEIKIGGINKENLEMKLRELEELNKRKESEYQTKLNEKDKEWQELDAKLKEFNELKEIGEEEKKTLNEKIMSLESDDLALKEILRIARLDKEKSEEQRKELTRQREEIKKNLDEMIIGFRTEGEKYSPIFKEKRETLEQSLAFLKLRLDDKTRLLKHLDLYKQSKYLSLRIDHVYINSDVFYELISEHQRPFSLLEISVERHHEARWRSESTHESWGLDVYPWWPNEFYIDFSMNRIKNKRFWEYYHDGVLESGSNARENRSCIKLSGGISLLKWGTGEDRNKVVGVNDRAKVIINLERKIMMPWKLIEKSAEAPKIEGKILNFTHYNKPTSYKEEFYNGLLDNDETLLKKLGGRDGWEKNVEVEVRIKDEPIKLKN